MHYLRHRYQEVIDRTKTGLSARFYDDQFNNYFHGIGKVEEPSENQYAAQRGNSDNARDNEVIEMILGKMNIKPSFLYKDVVLHKSRGRRGDS